jgi:type II secretory pathway predicted ATPase ExeA
MYLKFFGLQRLPFRLRPDREFLHLDAAYAALREALVQALGREGSIIVLTGQAGVGKTVLLESALDELRESRIALRISQPQMSPDELVRAIGEQLRAAVRAAENGRGTERLPADQPADDLQHSVGALSALGRRPVLIVDQAQLLAPETRHALRQMDGGAGPIDLVLIGPADSSELPPWARADALAGQLQPITVLPMTAERVGPYIERRLSIAGAQDPELFAKPTYRTLFEYSRGVPRLVNALCDAAMSLACSRALQRISEAEVVAATREPHWRNLQAQDVPSAAAPIAPIVSQPGVDTEPSAAPVPQAPVVANAMSATRADPKPPAASPDMRAAPADAALVAKAAADRSDEAEAAINFAPARSLPAVSSAAAKPSVLGKSHVAPAPAATAAARVETPPAETRPVASPTSRVSTAAAPPSVESPTHPPPLRTAPARFRLVVTCKAVTIAELPLKPGQLMIGRTRENDLMLDSKFVSRTHCALITVVNGLSSNTTVIDLGSRNGTLVNGKFTARQKLVSGDLIRVGDFLLKYL